MAVSKAEFLWREWVLGEERYEGKGPRSSPRPDVGYGDPSKGQKPVPEAWWKRLEAFLVRRHDYAEAGSKPDPNEPTPKPGKRGQLSPHFNVSEFDCHNGQKVPAIAIPALTRLCVDYLEKMRAKFGVATILSGYRPEAYNRSIGGARYSQHIYELTPSSVAADSFYVRGTPAQWAAYADRLGAGGVGRYDRAGFVHIDNRPGHARWTG
jgi:hypothetical protein